VIPSLVMVPLYSDHLLFHRNMMNGLQGTLLDQIDHNVENTCKTMEKAHVELQKAETYQKSGRFIKCVSILGLIIVVLLVLLIFKR